MKFVTDFMGWLAHSGAPWRAYPEAGPHDHHLGVVQARRPAVAPARPWSVETAPDRRLSRAMEGLDHCDPRVHPREWLIAASRMSGVPIFRKDGRRVGQISDLSIDRRSGRITYALVAFGGRPCERFHPLPWALLTYDLDKDGYVVPFDTSSLAAAPSLTRDELQWFGAGDGAWREKVAAYYSPHLLMPYI